MKFRRCQKGGRGYIQGHIAGMVAVITESELDTLGCKNTRITVSLVDWNSATRRARRLTV